MSKTFALVLATITLALLWYVGLVQYVIRFAMDDVLIAALLPIVVVVALLFAAERPHQGVNAILATFVVIGLGLWLYQGRMTDWARSYEHGTVQLTQAPDTQFVPRRILPMEIASAFASGAQTDARYVYGNIHPTIATDSADSGHLVWQLAQQPNSFVGGFSSGLGNVLEVNADTTSPDMHVYAMNLPRGGEGNFNDFARVIHRTIDPFSEAMPPVYDVARREALVPLVRTVWGIPRFHSVAVFDTAGDVTVLSPAQAAHRYPRLRLYPEDLVLWQAKTWGHWRSGLAGLFTKKNILEVAEIGSNPAPTLLDDAKRAQWIVPMEPEGRSYGLAGLLFVNPVTGVSSFWNTSKASVISPSRSLDIAEGDPRVAQWKSSVALEPMLAIIHGKINWLVPISSATGSQVQAVALINAHDRSTLVAPTFAQVLAPAATTSAGVVGSSTGSRTLQSHLASIDSLLVAVRAQMDSVRIMAH